MYDFLDFMSGFRIGLYIAFMGLDGVWGVQGSNLYTPYSVGNFIEIAMKTSNDSDLGDFKTKKIL